MIAPSINTEHKNITKLKQTMSIQTSVATRIMFKDLTPSDMGTKTKQKTS